MPLYIRSPLSFPPVSSLNVIQPTGDAVVALSLKQHSGTHTAPLLQFLDSSGNALGSLFGAAGVLQGLDGAGADRNGADLLFASGRSTGLGTSGNLRFQMAPPALGTGSALNALYDKLLLAENIGSVLQQHAGTADYLRFVSQEAASAGTTTRRVPGLFFRGFYWTGAASQFIDVGIDLNVADTSPTYQWRIVTNGQPRFWADQAGNITIGPSALTAALFNVAGSFAQQSSVGSLFRKWDANGNDVANGVNVSLLGLVTPASVTVTPQGTPGATTYGYRISAVNGQGETVAAASTTTATGNAALTGSNFNRVAWAAVAGATSYKVYGRTSGSELLIATVTAPTATYDDTGAVTPSGALPSAPVGTTLKLSRWASQTGDIATWYMNDGTTVLGKIDSTGSLQAPTGLSSAPSITFSAAPTIGLYQIGGTDIAWTFGGTVALDFFATGFALASGAQLSWSSTTNAATGAPDLKLVRDGANMLALRNSTAPQTQNWYETFTNTSNYSRAFLSMSSAGLFVGTQAAGTGTQRSLFGVQLQANGQALNIQSLTEATTIAAAATTDTVIQIPAGAIVVGVAVRVTTVIPTATAFDVGIAGATTRYGTGILVAATTTYPGTDDGLRFYAAGTKIRFTPNIQPAAATGVVRVTIHYITLTPATS